MSDKNIIDNEAILKSLEQQKKVLESALPEINKASMAFPDNKDFKEQQSKVNELLNKINQAISTYK